MVTVTKYATENTGGGCMVDFIVLSDGTYLSLNDELVMKWEMSREHMGMNDIINEWYDNNELWDGETAPHFVDSKKLSYNAEEWPTLKNTTYVHSFPNNKLFTVFQESINLETLEVINLKEKLK